MGGNLDLDTLRDIYVSIIPFVLVMIGGGAGDGVSGHRALAAEPALRQLN